MLTIAKDFDLRFSPKRIPVDVTPGTCALAVTSSPFILPVPGTACFAILGSWLPSNAPVGMLITFRDYLHADGDKQVREVHSVYAAKTMRGHPNAAGYTTPVTIGRWLFAKNYLTLHSADRTDPGEKWAKAVGGERPPRDQQGTEENMNKLGEGALVLLNQHPWDVAPWPDLDQPV